MAVLDLEALNRAPLQREPFDYVVVPNFIPAAAAETIERAFPAIPGPGSFPPGVLRYGDAFQRLLDELYGPEFAQALGAKFDIDLTALPTMLTVRGHTAAHDGRIHHDRRGKVVTVLLYLNKEWDREAARLRLLRSRDNLEDYAAEIAPEMGTLLVFRCTGNAWHGHKPFVGPRRAIQLNWVNSRLMCWWEQSRHSVSAIRKKLFPKKAA